MSGIVLFSNEILLPALEAKDKRGELAQDVVSFFEKNEEASDEEFHKWAEDNGIPHEDAEEAAYRLLTTFVKFLRNGRANEKNFEESNADESELKMGIKVEHEHTTDPETAKRIALDHLAEIPDYYTRLAKMEGEAGIEH